MTDDTAINLGAELYRRGGLKALRGPLFDPLIAAVEAEERAREQSRQARRDALGRPLRVLIAEERQRGKTTVLLEWLAGGVAIPDRPKWSRVVLCARPSTVPHLRAQVYKDLGPTRLPLDAQVVFDAMTWPQTCRGMDPLIEVAIDDADILLHQIAGGRRLVGVTMTGEGYTMAER